MKTIICCFLAMAGVVINIYAQIPTDGLMAYYPFNGSANDESGNGNNGYIIGGVSSSADRFGNESSAYNFDGSTGYIRIPNSASLQTPISAMTITGWFYINQFNPPYGHITILSKSESSEYGQYHLMYHEWQTQQFHFFMNHGSIGGVSSNMNEPLSYGKWYFIASTWDGDTAKIYINDSLVGKSPCTGNMTPDNNPIVIGLNTPGTTVCYTNAKIDEVRMYNRSLSSIEINSLYHEGGWPQTSAVEDVDGNTYSTVQIGTQVWMKENLKTAKYRNGDAIPNITDNTAWGSLTTGAYSDYDNTPSKSTTYGRLYNFYAVADSRKICPTGWHVPSDGEWKMLETYLGLSQDNADLEGWRGTDQGTQLKNTSGWINGGSGTNTSGFTALPGGCRYPDDIFAYDGYRGYWWSSTEISSDLIWYRGLINDFSNIGRDNRGGKKYGFSVRCLKDYSVSNGLLAYFPFNGNVNDECGNGNSGTLDGAVPATDRFGNPGKAYSFNGLDNGINYGPVDIPVNNFSASLWFNPKDYKNSDELLYNANGNVGFNIFLSQDYTVNFMTVASESSANMISVNLGAGSLNKWHHIVAISNNGLVQIYINGVLSASQSGVPGVNSTNNLYSGYDYGVNRYFYNGFLDDVRIFNRTLSAAGVDSLYHEGGWPQTAVVADIDGNVYKTVTIGNQKWMAENLKTSKYQNGDTISNVQDSAQWLNLNSGAYCYYDNEVSNFSTYGGLYNWYVASDSRNVCPAGWHVPTDEEWKNLEIFLGMSQDAANSMLWRGDNQGAQLKNINGWNPGIDGTNTTGFSALPGGTRVNTDDFIAKGNYGYWWTSSSFNSNNALWRSMAYWGNQIYRDYHLIQSGFSIRCLADSTPAISLPSLITKEVSNITSEAATSGGNITNDGGSSVTARGVCWSIAINPTIADNKTIDGNGIAEFTSSINGLTPNTTYYIRAYATNSAGTAYGNEVSATPLTPGSFIYSDNFDRTEIGADYIVRAGNWSISESTLMHQGDGTFNSNFLILNQPVNYSNYSVAVDVKWQGGGFLEDGIASGYKMEPLMTNNQIFDDYNFAYLSSWGTTYGGGPHRSGIYKFYRQGDEALGVDSAKELGWSVQAGIWYQFKVEARTIGNLIHYKFYVDGVLTNQAIYPSAGNQIALGGWKGEYGQVVLFDNLEIRSLDDFSPNPVAFYPFNGNALDESGIGNNGTVNGATLTADRFGNASSAYNFLDYDNINIGNKLSDVFSDNIYSISLWYNRSVDNKRALIHKWQNCCPNTGNNAFWATPEGIASNTKVSETPFPMGAVDTWTNWVVVFNSGTLKTYIDGVLVMTEEGHYSVASTMDLKISSEAPQYSFNGKIDDIRIFDRAVSSTEIEALYHEGGWPLAPLPAATISGTTATCKDAASPNITFTGANGTSPYTFTYSVNGGGNQTITTTAGNSVTIPVPTGTAGVFTYSLVSVYDAGGIANSQAQTGNAIITVNNLPTAFVSGTTVVCKDASFPNINFTGANGTPPYAFTYRINGGVNQTITTTLGNSIQVAVPTSVAGTFTYTLINVRDASSTSCIQSQSGSAVVTINPLPTATISGSTAVCKDAVFPNVTFTGANGTAPYTFTYTINSGIIQSITSIVGNSVTVSVPTNVAGTFTYALVSVRDASVTACLQLQSGSATVVVNPLPTATISGTTAVCRNEVSPLIRFTGASGTTPYIFTYKINGGSNQTITTTVGNSITVPIPTPTPGTFTYALVSVRDASSTACLQAQSGNAIVTINPLPTATISGTTTVNKNAASPNITFTGASGSAPYTFTYTINGLGNQTVTTTIGNSINIAVPTGTAGTYTYALVSVRDASSTACLQAQTGSATVTVLETISIPQNLTSRSGDKEITLEWDPVNSSSFGRYRIYMGTTAGSYNLIDSTSFGDPGDVIRTITGLTNGITYFFRITAVNNSGNASAFSNEISATAAVIVYAELSFGLASDFAGNVISVPVQAEKFNDIAGFQFTVVYDQSKLSYIDCSDWGGGISSAGIQITSLPAQGKISFVYNDEPVTIANDKLFDINFMIAANATGNAVISWSDVPTYRELSNSEPAIVPCNYTSGTVTILAGRTLSGRLTYDNPQSTILEDVTIHLNKAGDTLFASGSTDISGNYSFTGLPEGQYSLKPEVLKPWGGATAMDITFYKKHIGNLITLSPIRMKSGDVNNDGKLSTIDLTFIKQRIGFRISTFIAGDWTYENPGLTLSGTDLTQDIKALCYGDANGSYIPQAGKKSLPELFISSQETIVLSAGQRFDLPLRVNTSLYELSSVTLTFTYPSDLMDITDIRMTANNEDLYYTLIDGTARVIYSTLDPLNMQESDLLMTISCVMKESVSSGIQQNAQLSITGTGEFGDYDDNVLEGVQLVAPKLSFGSVGVTFDKKDIRIYPNPAQEKIIIENAKDALISIHDILGKSLLIKNCISDSEQIDIGRLNPGTYVIKIVKNDQLTVRDFVVVKE